VRAASLAGVRHRLAAEAGDDSYAWCHDGDKIALGVADGLGSVPGSAGAAETSVRIAVEIALRENLPAAFAAANQAIGTEGLTTLLVAVVQGTGVELARVGDSSAFVVAGGGTWRELFLRRDDDSVGTDTDALPSEELAVESAETGLGVDEVLVLATDGLANPWRDGPTTVGPALVEVLARPPSPLELMRVADFSRQGCHDDRTLVCLWRR
jgi:serine/threonine protein phosphatase PrpC